MILCMPKGVCSWDYVIRSEHGQTSVVFHWAKEQGRIVINSVSYDVVKHGVASGHWTLEKAGKVMTSAYKKSSLRRTFKLHSEMGTLKLRSEKPLNRSFMLMRENQEILRVAPVHAFTRRATIDLRTLEVEWPTTCFAFWLVALMWRRSQSGSG